MKETLGHNIKILQVTSGFRKGISGGIASVLHNYCTASAFESGVDFDYLSLGYQTFEPYREDLEDGGGHLYCLNIHVNGAKRLFEIYRRMKRFLNGKDYDIVHVNSGALTQVLASCMAAKAAKTKVVIAHSHNAIVKKGMKAKIYGLLKLLVGRYADVYFACSKMAAKSMFPENIIQEKKWRLIPNAIDTARFAFDKEIRRQYRKDLGIEGRFVIGHVGRFNEQKNHTFLIDVFAEVAKERSDAVLLLVGTGELIESIKEKVKDLGLEDRVIFTGRREDANCLMQAMDVFAFPSLFEGLGMVLIEAQTAGLKVVTSDRVPIKETQVSKLITYLPLDKADWIKFLIRAGENGNRADSLDSIINAGYELDFASKRLKEYYIDEIREVESRA